MLCCPLRELTSIEQSSTNCRSKSTIQCKEAFVLHYIYSCFQLQDRQYEHTGVPVDDASATAVTHQARRLCAVWHSDSLELHSDLCDICNQKLGIEYSKILEWLFPTDAREEQFSNPPIGMVATFAMLTLTPLVTNPIKFFMASDLTICIQR